MSDGGNQSGNSNGSDAPDTKRQKLSSDVNAADTATNYDEFQLNNDQLDDILNDTVPGIDVGSNPDALDFNFDNILTDFLNDSSFGTPHTVPDGAVSDFGSSLPSAGQSGVQSGVASSGVPSGVPSHSPTAAPSRGASIGPSSDTNQQQPKTSNDTTGSTTTTPAGYPNSKEPSADVNNNNNNNSNNNNTSNTNNINNNNINENDNRKSYTSSPAPLPSKVQRTPQNLNIYTGNGGINNVSAGTAVPIANRSNPVSTTNSSTNLAASNINRSNSSVNVSGARAGTPPVLAYKNGKNNGISNSTSGVTTAGGVNRPLIYNAKTAPPVNRMNPVVQQAQGIQGMNTTNIDRPTTYNSNISAPYGGPGAGPGAPGFYPGNPALAKGAPNSNVAKSQLHTDDPSKLNDALAAAGVDIQQEEELLMQQHANRNRVYTTQQQLLLKQRQQQAQRQSPFLNPYHLASYMQKVARENGVHQNFLQDGELLELMSAACENWISTLSTKTLILSRHRRRGIPTLIEGKSNGKRGNNSSTPSTQRSEISRELRNMAARQKEQEEKRVQKRIALGLENGATGESENGKAGAEETLHRAANATATMMTMTGRKKYSWMTAGASGGGGGGSGASSAGDDGSNRGDSEGKAKQSSIIAIRGDNGLRYREIRTGKSVTMKDLLGALEDERMGVDKALIKGYAKLKD